MFIVSRIRNIVETRTKIWIPETIDYCMPWVHLCVWRRNQGNQSHHPHYNHRSFYARILIQFLQSNPCRWNIFQNQQNFHEILVYLLRTNSSDLVDRGHKVWFGHDLQVNIECPCCILRRPMRGKCWGKEESWKKES